MRVVLYYDLLRFSPCSIDLFISMNISPPSLQPLQTKAPACGVRKVSFFRLWCMSFLVHLFYWIRSFFFAESLRKSAKSVAGVIVWRNMEHGIWNMAGAAVLSNDCSVRGEVSGGWCSRKRTSHFLMLQCGNRR